MKNKKNRPFCIIKVPPKTIQRSDFLMKHDHISFIDYNMDQLCLPLDLEVKIPQNHLSRIVHQAVE